MAIECTTRDTPMSGAKLVVSRKGMVAPLVPLETHLNRMFTATFTDFPNVRTIEHRKISSYLVHWQPKKLCFDEIQFDPTLEDVEDPRFDQGQCLLVLLALVQCSTTSCQKGLVSSL